MGKLIWRNKVDPEDPSLKYLGDLQVAIDPRTNFAYLLSSNPETGTYSVDEFQQGTPYFGEFNTEPRTVSTEEEAKAIAEEWMKDAPQRQKAAFKEAKRRASGMGRSRSRSRF